MRVRRRSTPYALVCAAALALFAAGAGGCLPTVYNKRPEVKGTVRDTTGQPIRGATVRVSAAETPAKLPVGGPAAARTDARGRFKVPGSPKFGFYWVFQKPREWTWKVQAEAPGHTAGSVELWHRGQMPKYTFANVKFRLPAQ
jgi:hypothetical protein